MLSWQLCVVVALYFSIYSIRREPAGDICTSAWHFNRVLWKICPLSKYIKNRHNADWIYETIFILHLDLLWLLNMILHFRLGRGSVSDRSVFVAAPHWQHVCKGGGCLSLVSVVRTPVPASFRPGWSRSVSSCTSCPSSSPRWTAPTCCLQTPQVRHYTSTSLSYCLQGSQNITKTWKNIHCVFHAWKSYTVV